MEQEELQETTMESNQGPSPNWLSLPPEVAAMIIKHVMISSPDEDKKKKKKDKNKGNLKTVLNLREVCTTTKDWVDKELGVIGGRRLFQNCQIHVDLAERKVRTTATIERFLKYPPPRHITSLRLSGVSKAGCSSNAFRRFGEYWTTRDDLNGPHFLESLELDTYSVSSSAVMEFLRSPNMSCLRKFRYSRIVGTASAMAEVGGPFPSFFTHLQEFQVDEQIPERSLGNRNGHDDDLFEETLKCEFITKVTLSCTLKKLILHEEDTSVLIPIVKGKKNDPDFTLEIRGLHKSLYHCSPVELENFRSLHKAIVESKSCIKLFDVADGYVSLLLAGGEYLGIPESERILKLRQGVQRFTTVVPAAENTSRNFESRVKGFFPNLKTIVFGELDYPFGFGNFHPAVIFRNLGHPAVTSVTFKRVKTGQIDLVRILSSVNKRFPKLRSLEIKWEREEEDEEIALHEEQVTFRKLRSLDFTLDLGTTKVQDSGVPLSSAKALKNLLLVGLNLPKLKLKSMNISVVANGISGAPLARECFELIMDNHFLTSLSSKKGRIGKNLAKLSTSHPVLRVNPDAQAALDKLEAKIKKNYTKRVRSVGLARGQLII